MAREISCKMQDHFSAAFDKHSRRHKIYKERQIDSISILQFRINIPKAVKMLFPRFHNRIGKVCALVAAALILPALAYAGGNNNDQGGNNQGGNNQGGNNQGGNNQGGVHTVPEGGPGIVLLMTTFGAILLFSARRASRAKT
jgi:hypothetical protein